MDQAGEVPEECQQDVQPEVGTEALLKQNAERRQKDSSNQSQDVHISSKERTTMKYLVVLGLLTLSFLVCGCNANPETEAQRQQRLTSYSATNFPNGATNVRDLGNDWYYFELQIEGRQRKFMYRRTGCGNTVTDCVTELSP